MLKTTISHPHGRGRPSMNLKRRCIGLSQDDYTLLKEIGLGSIASGVREAVKLIRKTRKLRQKAKGGSDDRLEPI